MLAYGMHVKTAVTKAETQQSDVSRITCELKPLMQQANLFCTIHNNNISVNNQNSSAQTHNSLN